jgi:hypothetical protein
MAWPDGYATTEFARWFLPIAGICNNAAQIAIQSPPAPPVNQSALSAFIWSVADLLRGNYKQSDYGKVILPFTVLRRLDCVLERTKAAGSLPAPGCEPIPVRLLRSVHGNWLKWRRFFAGDCEPKAVRFSLGP